MPRNWKELPEPDVGALFAPEKIELAKLEALRALVDELEKLRIVVVDAGLVDEMIQCLGRKRTNPRGGS